MREPDDLQPVFAELETGGILDDLAAIARRHRVMVSVTISPYGDDEGVPA